MNFIRKNWMFGLAVALLLIVWHVPSKAEIPLPPKARVIDTANVLTTAQLTELSQQSQTIELNSQTVLLAILVPSLQGEPIEQFAMRAAEAYHPGIAGVDRAAILVIATKDRKVRIETSRELGALVPDLATKQILNSMKSSMKQADWAHAVSLYYVGISGYLTSAVATEKAAETAAPVPVSEAKALPESDHSMPVIVPLLGVGGVLLIVWGLLSWRSRVVIEREMAERQRAREERRAREEAERMARAEWEQRNRAIRERDAERERIKRAAEAAPNVTSMHMPEHRGGVGHLPPRVQEAYNEHHGIGKAAAAGAAAGVAVITAEEVLRRDRAAKREAEAKRQREADKAEADRKARKRREEEEAERRRRRDDDSRSSWASSSSSSSYSSSSSSSSSDYSSSSSSSSFDGGGSSSDF